jgi:FKBP-type peptidyl-prolyl cis-trans isomerase
MKITQIAIALLLAFGIISCQEKSNNVSINTKTDSISYIIGAYQGQSMLQNFERSKVDSLINIDTYLKAFNDAVDNKTLKIEPDSNQMMVQMFFQQLQTSLMMAAQDSTGTHKFSPDKGQCDSVSYILGAQLGKGLVENFSKDGLDTILSIPIIINGYISAINKEDLKIETEANLQMVDAFFRKLQEEKMLEKYGDNKNTGEEFLAKNRAKEGVMETSSGLQYEIIEKGTGAKPIITDKVKVHYTGSFVDGKVFDSSVERGEPAVFGVGQVIPGWTEALQLMPVGSKWKLYIPYELAYGAQGRNSIPPYSMLIFEVELISIEK